MLGLMCTGGRLEVEPRVHAASARARPRIALRIGEVRMGIADACEIARARAVAERGEDRVVAAVGLALAHQALRIADVAENDGLGGAGLLAGGANVAVAQRA